MSRLLLMGIENAPGITGPFLTINSTVKITIDANSIWEGVAVGLPKIEDLGPLTAFKTNTGCTINNTSIAGQTWAGMASAITDVNASWDAAKTNVLVAGETRNSFFNGFTYSQTLAQIHDYVNAVLAAHPGWIIVLMGSLPSDGVASAADENLGMLAVDEYVRDNLAEFSARSWFGYRDIDYFSYDGTARQGFMESTTNCIESVSPWVHPKGPARDRIAERMASALQQIPL